MSYGLLIVQELRKALERRGYEVTPETVDAIAREVQRKVRAHMEAPTTRPPFDAKAAQAGEQE
jgi:hypothetical protein